MKLNSDYILKKVGDETVIVSTNPQKPLNNNITLSKSAVFLWNTVKENPNISKEVLLESLLNEFDISTVLGLSNIDIFLKILKQNGILDE